MKNKEKILIGKITSTHGVKGQVKIMSFCANPVDIGSYNPVYDKSGNSLKIKITSKAQGKNLDIFIISIDGINNVNEAMTLRNSEVFIDRSQLKQEEEDEFYYVDIIGLDVIDEQKTNIGKVVDVMNYGAGDILEIEFNDNFLQAKKQKEKIQMFSVCDEIFPIINPQEGFVQMIFPQTIEIE